VALVGAAGLLTDIKYRASDELEGRVAGGVGCRLDMAVDTSAMNSSARASQWTPCQGGPIPDVTMSTGAKARVPSTRLIENHGPDGHEPDATLNTDFCNPVVRRGRPGACYGERAFCGYGIAAPDKNFDEFAGIRFKGTVAVILRRVPQQGHPTPMAPFGDTRRGLSTHAELRTKIDRGLFKRRDRRAVRQRPLSGRERARSMEEAGLQTAKGRRGGKSSSPSIRGHEESERGRERVAMKVGPIQGAGQRPPGQRGHRTR